MTTPLRLALVGCGRIARGRHLPILAASPAFDVRALVDPDPAALKAAAGKLPKAKPLSSLADLAPGDAEAVLIASPTPLHANQAVEAFEAGYHVYLEKPIATSLDDALRVEAAWRASGRIGIVGFNYRFHPMIAGARAALQRKELGRLVALRSVFSTPGREHPDWKCRRESGGGALLDLATHHVDSYRFITGLNVERVRGWIESRRTEHDTGGLELTLEGGVLGQILVAMGGIDEDRIEVIGEDGALILDRLSSGTVFSRPASRKGLQQKTAIGAVQALASSLVRRGGTEVSTTASLRNFAQVVRGNAVATPTIEDGLTALRAVLEGEADALNRPQTAGVRP